MAKRILITGASGLVGSHLLYLCPPDDAIGTYHHHRPDEAKYEYIRLDLEDAKASERLLRELRPEICIHAAARSNLDWCELHPGEAWRINAEAPVALARDCRDIGCRYLFVSTDMVFDGKKGNYSEDDPPHPINLYGRAKRAAEQGILQEYPDAVVARIALVYGMPVAPGRGQSFLNWLLGELRAGRTVSLLVDQYRTPVEVRECARALLDLALSDATGVVHVAGAERIDRYTFGEYVAEFFGLDRNLLKKASVRDIQSEAPRPVDVSMTISRLEHLLGRRMSTCRDGLIKLALNL
ncbi:MAG: SDR family oxidoreductase [candidate division KSB1 bacterium]|nr:SDR family oxidoreductase [candidate division KSB1 bacterium]